MCLHTSLCPLQSCASHPSMIIVTSIRLTVVFPPRSFEVDTVDIPHNRLVFRLGKIVAISVIDTLLACICGIFSQIFLFK